MLVTLPTGVSRILVLVAVALSVVVIALVLTDVLVVTSREVALACIFVMVTALEVVLEVLSIFVKSPMAFFSLLVVVAVDFFAMSIVAWAFVAIFNVFLGVMVVLSIAVVITFLKMSHVLVVLPFPVGIVVSCVAKVALAAIELPMEIPG